MSKLTAGDAIDDEVPGALPADRPGVQPVVLDDQPFVPYQGVCRRCPIPPALHAWPSTVQSTQRPA